jgi:methionine synthase II (cobalamin-independent)
MRVATPACRPPRTLTSRRSRGSATASWYLFGCRDEPVEHPELVAQRIVQYARVVGRENLMAGVDCGFATFAGRPTVEPAIAWAKLGAMVEGARLASRELWG